MRNLLKTDIRRIRKDKLFLIVCILAGVFSVITPLLNKLIFSGLDALGEGIAAEMGMMVSAKSMFFSAFSPGNNLGLIAPILIAIILCKDFSFGTIRNKIIHGERRRSIFLSMFLSGLLAMWIIMLLYALLTLAISLLLFDYQSTPFTGKDMLYSLESVLFALCSYVFVAALVSCLCVTMKNAGIAIVIYVLINMALSMIGSLLPLAADALSMVEGKEFWAGLVTFLSRVNIFHTATTIGAGTSYALKDVLYILLPSLVGAAAFLGLGLMVFKKKDIK